MKHWGGGIKLIRPDTKTAAKTEQNIFKLINCNLTESDRTKFRKVVNNFIQSQKLDAVILGCTELPLVFGDGDDPRIIDTLKVLCDGLLEHHFKS
ncbi:MAG: hypothetical protein WCP11_02445 [Candidatus Saccharibacteria bacterium]